MKDTRRHVDAEASLALLCDLSRAGARVRVGADGVHVRADGPLGGTLKARLARQVGDIAFLADAAHRSTYALAGQVLLAGLRALGYEAEAVGDDLRWWPHEPANEAVRAMLDRHRAEVLFLLHTDAPLPRAGRDGPPAPAGTPADALGGLLDHCRQQAAAHERAVARLRRPVCAAHALPYWRERAQARQALCRRWHGWADALEHLIGGGPQAREPLGTLLVHVRRQVRRACTLAERGRVSADAGKWAVWARALAAVLAVAPAPG